MFYERVLEIIIFILNELKEHKSFKDIDYEALSKFGYTDSEINTAIAWIYSKIQENENIFFKKIKSTKSIRVLNPIEKNLFTLEALGYMISFLEFGLISEEDFEFIIDKVMSSGFSKVELPEIKNLLSVLVLNLENPNDKRNRLLLNNNDTIN